MLVSRESYQTTKVELYQEHTRDKVRRRFTLLVTAVTWWDDGAGTDVLVILAAVVVRGSVKLRQRQRLSRRLIKMLNGSVDVLSWLYAMYALPTRGNYELWAPLLLSVVRGLFRRQQYRGLIAGKWCCLICHGVWFVFALI